MAANTVTKTFSYAGTQAGAFVDTVTFTKTGDRLLVDNTHATIHLSFTYSSTTDTAATPTYLGDNTFYVPAGSFRSYPFRGVKSVKLIGASNGMTYVVAVV